MSFSVVEMLVAGAVGAVSVAAARVGLLVVEKVSGKSTSRPMARIITVAALAGSMVMTALLIAPRMQQNTYREQLANGKMFGAARKYYPDEYELLVAKVDAGMARGEEHAYFAQLGTSFGQELIARHLDVASNKAAHDLARANAATYREVKQQAPNACRTSLTGNTSELWKLDASLSDATKAMLEDVAFDVLQSSATAPQPLVSEAQTMDIVAPIMQELQQKYGDSVQVLSGQPPANLEVDDATVCDMVIDFYDLLIALPPEKGGAAYRGLSAMQ